MDALLSTGEQVSVALMAMAMASLGVPAVSLNAFQVAMHTTHHHMNSRFKKVDTDRINAELDQGKVVIVTGFQGVNRYDDVTTLGRGGSDTTAVALAAVLGADACEIYTDVDGVYTADPRIVPNNRSVEMAKKYNVPLVVRSSLTKAEGTVVKEVTKVESMLVSGVAVDKDADRIALIGLKNEPGIAFKVFDLLAKKNINVDMILQSMQGLRQRCSRRSMTLE